MQNLNPEEYCKFITSNRFDLMAKYLYVKYFEIKERTNFFIELYKDHINTFNGCYELPDPTVGDNKIHKKNIQDFIKAFNDLKIKNKLLIFGDGIELEKLKKLANGNNNIEFKGKVSSDEISKAYDQVDVIINPRIKSYLTDTVTPLKPLEAMAYKKLVLVSDVGGMKELVKNEFNGIVFNSDSYKEIKNVIIDVINRNDLDKIIENGYMYIKEEKSWKINAKKYYSIYENLIND